jgi:hypothetical protein
MGRNHFDLAKMGDCLKSVLKNESSKCEPYLRGLSEGPVAGFWFKRREMPDVFF